MRQIFNIPEDDKAIRDHLKCQEDISKYIRHLIRQDMSNNKITLEEKIKQIVSDVLKDKNISIENHSIDSSISNSIKNILG